MYYLGLVNFGNTCYMNAVIQSLKPFSHIFEIMESDSMVTAQLSYLLGMTSSIDEPPSEYYKQVVAAQVDFIDGVLRKLPGYDNFEQHDAVEFLGSLFDLIQSESIAADSESGPRTTSVATGSNRPADVYTSELSPYEVFDLSTRIAIQSSRSDLVSTYFTGQHLDVIKCLKCDSRVSYAFTPYTIMALPVTVGSEPITHIRDSYAKYSEAQMISDMICDRCTNTDSRSSSKVTTYANHPDILIIQLGRFIYSRETSSTVKIEHSVRFEFEMTFGSLESDADPTMIEQIYDLQSVIFHSGPAADEGHYTTASLRDDEWYYFDDGKAPMYIDEESKSQLLDLNTAYILFYGKRGEVDIESEEDEETFTGITAAQSDSSLTDKAETSGEETSQPKRLKIIGPKSDGDSDLKAESIEARVDMPPEDADDAEVDILKWIISGGL
jgi:ubiquitin carboxyl-terminal hydrolase 8